MTVQEWLGEDNQLGIDIWQRKYQKNNETFDEWVDRVSLHRPEVAELIYQKKFLPAGRILSNVGIDDNKAGMSNCYSRGFIQDDYNDIMQAAVDIGKTFKAQGGQGLSLSKLRPKGTPIGDKYESDGIIPFMKIYNEVTAGTSQGGARKGALLMSLDAWHKEAMNFITIKSADGPIEKANLSLEIDDEFMDCVDAYYKTGEVRTVHRKETYSGHVVEWEVTPIEVFKAFIHNNYDWGDPGCIFVNRFRNYNLMQYCDNYEIETCNPCGEQPLSKNSACNLASINLSEFVKHPYTPSAFFDYGGFKNAVSVGIKYLDEIIDLNASRHALPEQRENSLKFRNCGLGVFGYATMLMKLGLKYGSIEARSFTSDLFDEMFRQAVFASSALARDLGSFPGYKPVVWQSDIIRNHFSYSEIADLKKDGLRNCSLLSIAPCGSISSMINESSSAEPEFAIEYTRRTVGLTDNQDHYYKVRCKAAKEYIALYPYAEDNLPDYFVSATEIDPISRVLTQADIQEHIDTAISSTVNLPNDCTEDQMAQIYLEAWRKGVKGLTIFRDGCKRQGILTTHSTPSAEDEIDNSLSAEDTLKRGDVISTSDGLIGLKRRLMTGCGTLHCSAFFDPVTGDLMETYLSKGSTGGCLNTLTAMSRLISLSARAGLSIEQIVDQLNSCGVCPSYAVRTATKHDTSKGSCCPIAVGNALLDMHDQIMRNVINYDPNDTIDKHDDQVEQPAEDENGRPNNVATCPECGEPLIFEGGCNICKSCGWSKCS